MCRNFETYKREKYLECFVVHMTMTTYQQKRTCALGKVVDEKLKKYGVDNLLFVDASVMPEIVRRHRNAVVLLMAEKASDLT